jgi:hypothetical protein
MIRYAVINVFVSSVIFLCTVNCEAALLSWGATSDLPNGVLGLTSLAVNGPEIRFTNPGGEGFDVGFSMTSPNAGFTGNMGFFGSSDELALPDPPPPAGGHYIYFNPATNSPNTVYFHVRFYSTGTNDPVDVVGFETQLEDVERGGDTREWLVGPKITSAGVDEHLSFSNTSIFTLPSGSFIPIIENVNVNSETVERAVPGHGVLGGTQPGKTVGIDLSTTALSYFRLGTSKASNGGSWLMGPIGDIQLASNSSVPEPGTLTLTSLALLSFVGLVCRRRK